jgi:hypothetical protein
MSSPASGNDDWDDLARELGVSKSAPPPAPPPDMVERIVEAEAVEPHHGDPRAEDDALGAGEPELAVDESPDAQAPDNPNATGEPIPADDAERKRKRRRRRRRRKGAPVEGTEPVATGPDDDAAEPDEDEVSETADGAEANEDEEAFADAAGEAAEDAPYEDALQPVGAEEEDVATDALRDLIANWNVPAWDEIIGGLYRPN